MREPEPEDSPPGARRPPWRSPYAWAFVLGVALVSVLRFACVRRPDPPPVLGKIPDFAAVGPGGAEISLSTLRGEPWVLVLAVEGCERTCRRARSAAGELARRYAEMGAPVRVVVLDPLSEATRDASPGAAISGAEAGEPLRARGSGEDACRTALAAFGPLTGEGAATCADLHAVAHAARSSLIDGHGRLRGVYDLDAQGLDEVHHRSGHVLREERIERRRAGDGRRPRE